MDNLSGQREAEFELMNNTDDNVELSPDVKVETRWRILDRRLIVVIGVAVVLLIVGIATSIPHILPKTISIDYDTQKPWTNMRLSSSVIPIKYDLRLNVDMVNDSYSGNVTITVQVMKRTKWILLHSVGLDIKQTDIINLAEQSLKIENTFFYEKNDFYVIQIESILQKDETYLINIGFNGKIQSGLIGFYTSFYQSGKTKNKVASTFFSPIGARKTFPCYDEPKYKATFILTLTHSSEYHALSNMHIEKVTTNHNLTTTKFSPSIKMSTYILFWVVSNFGYVEKANSTNPVLKAWGPKDKVKGLYQAVDVTSKLLRFCEEYFNISFPLKKLDTIAIPSLLAEAMENWGAITYKSALLIQDENVSTDKIRQLAFNVIAHELIHQWFGNLVTMEFWSDAWLKEGFSDNIAILAGQHIDKSMELEEHVLTDLMLPALEADAYSTSHPVSININSTEEIYSVFNIITYNKGSCMVELLKQFLGAEDFRRGLQRYLKTYSYRNANRDDLWHQMSIVSGKDVKKVLDTWILQMGYPLITVKRINATILEIRQERFTLDPPDIRPVKSPFNYLWKVPLIFLNPKTRKTKSYLFEDGKAFIDVPEEYFILNPDHSLFYRVHYDKKMSDTMKRHLFKKNRLLTAKDRTGFLSDQFNLVKAELIDIDTFMDILPYLKIELEFSPWKVGLQSLSYIWNIIDDELMKTKFDLYIKDITLPAIRRFKWNNPTSIHDSSLQVLLLEEACRNNVMEKVDQAKQIFISWMKGNKLSIRADLQSVVRVCAIAHGPQSFWEFTWKRYREGGPMQQALLKSLVATRNDSLIKRLLNYTFDDNIFNAQDAPNLISSLAKRSSHNRKLCWIFMKENWERIVRVYDPYWLNGMVENVLKYVSTNDELYGIEKFFVNVEKRKQLLYEIESNIRWRTKHLKKLYKWLKTHKY